MSKRSDREAVLSVRDLAVEFLAPEGALRAVDGVSFDIYPDEVLGIVGESGSGKSVAMLAVMGLLPPGRARVARGEVWFQGQDLTRLSSARMRRIRGNQLAMVFQDPTTSLNPVLTVGSQIAEAISLHQPQLSRAAIRAQVVGLLGMVGVSSPQRRARQYPHEYSGGMRQRVMIAIAMANQPAVLIADEPTTALDVTIQAQVLELLAEVREQTHAAMIMITHDLALIAETADRVAVMYAGQVLEHGAVDEVFAAPRHPYTAGLLASLPEAATEALYSIPGQPPELRRRPAGCVFHPRCGLRQGRQKCVDQAPVLDGTSHPAACHFADETSQWRGRMLAEIGAGATSAEPSPGAPSAGGRQRRVAGGDTS
ncbi:MAG: ABC transporter ATP-binding protein [Micromonosporaceae bacterium]